MQTKPSLVRLTTPFFVSLLILGSVVGLLASSPDSIGLAQESDGRTLTLSPASVSRITAESSSPDLISETLWVSGGPNGAPIRDVVLSPEFSNDQTMFVGTWGSGVYGWNDSTGEWEARNDELGVLRVTALAISPAFTDDHEIFLAMDGGGVYTSTNGGGDWWQADSGLPAEEVYALVVSPLYETDRTLYAGLSNSGVYRSQNGAQSWSPVTTGIGISTVVELEISPSFATTGTVYARTRDFKLYHTEDGENWTPCADLPGEREAWSITLDPEGAILLVGTNSGIYTSDDQCASWSPVPGIDSIQISVYDIAVSPEFASDQTIWACSRADGIYRSTDAGVNWTQTITGTGDDFYCGALAVSPQFGSDNTIVAGNYGGSGGVYCSQDGGDNWQRQSNGMTWNVIIIVPSPNYQNDGTVFVGLTGGLYRSMNYGASWEPINDGYSIGGDGSAIALSPQYEQDGTLFAGGYGTGVRRSQDRGDTWSQIGLLGMHIDEIAISPAASLTEALILVGIDGNGIFRSENGGSSWQAITQGLTIDSAPYISFSPSFTDDQTIFVGSKNEGLYRSEDAGVNWTRLITGLVGNSVWGMDVAPNFSYSPTVMVATEEGVFQSEDGGDNWVAVPFTGTYAVTEVDFSPYYSEDQTIWLATMWKPEGGVFISQDSGDTWQPVNDGLTELDHYALALADRGQSRYDVFVGTKTQSVWQRYADVDIIVRARGSVAAGEWPRMQLRVNEAQVADWSVDTPEYTLWITQANLTGQDQIDILYPNDASINEEDRNLYVDYVLMGNAPIEPEDRSLVVFDQYNTVATELEAYDGLLMRGGQAALTDRGALRISSGMINAPVQPPQGQPIRRAISDTLIDEQTRLTWERQWDVAIDGNSNGDTVIVWRDGRNGHRDIYAQRLGSTGLLGSSFQVSDTVELGWQRHPDVLVNDDGSFVIVWADGWPVTRDQIRGQRYDSNGIAVDENFSATEDTNYNIYPSISGPGDGSFVIVWSDNWDGYIWGRRYDSAGDPTTEAFRVDDAVGSDARRRHADVAVASNGNFLVVWQDPRNGDLDIYGQWYDAEGTPIGANFLVNNDGGSSEQVTPDVAVDGLGQFIVTWRDRRNGDEDIYAQRYSRNRNPMGGNFRVNDDTTSLRQHAPRVAASDSGEFIITWWDRRSLRPDVYAQYFSRDGNPLEANFRVDDGVVDQSFCPDVAMSGAQEVWFAWSGQQGDYLDAYVNRWEPVAGCTVTSTADSGPGTLRGCLQQAQPFEYIDFDPTIFSPTVPATITPMSEIPSIITDGLTIDASDAGVVLDGSLLTGTKAGLHIDGAEYVVVRGLQVVSFPGDGITIDDGTSFAVVGGNRDIGEGTLGQGNLVSGNGQCGIQIMGTGAFSNTISGNLIGTNILGTAAISNAWSGISINGGSHHNIIGGTCEAGRNLISGNDGHGISIFDSGTSYNIILRNYVGTNISGTMALANGEVGVNIWDGPTHNLIGGHTPEEGNLISGNGQYGVHIAGTGTDNNTIGNNYIGTDCSRTLAIPNTWDGIRINNGAANVLTGNLVSGNEQYGIEIGGTEAVSNVIVGNLIGTNVHGTAAIGNNWSGLILSGEASHNTIGGISEAERNLISGNDAHGIAMYDVGTSHNVILGNYIGTNISGTMALANGEVGVNIWDGPAYNIIGGHTPEEGNLISGNGQYGVHIAGTATSNTIGNNYIGTDWSKALAIPNAWDGIYIHNGTNNIVIENLVSGNGDDGITLSSTGNNEVSGNQVGTDYSGTMRLGNLDDGIIVQESANNLVNDNLISGNGQYGIQIMGTGAFSNTIVGNLIGTNLLGTAAISNAWSGITLNNGAHHNIIGGASEADRNLISGNSNCGVAIYDAGTSNNTILGNYVGTNLSGTQVISNRSIGINIWNGPTSNTVGGYAAGSGNLVSGNAGDCGIQIGGDGTADNVVRNNYVGTDVEGVQALGNGIDGICIQLGATENLVESNLLSGNNYDGIYLYQTSNNVIRENFVGVDSSGSNALSNLDDGVDIRESVGNLVESNLISGNSEYGVVLEGWGTNDNIITENFIGTNLSGTISIGNGHNGIDVKNSASRTLVENNLISGNSVDGIGINDAVSTTVRGNLVGTDYSGMVSLGNLAHGIHILTGSSGTTIGGNRQMGDGLMGQGNLISGNGGSGIKIKNDGTLSTTIVGNSIGVDLSGDLPLPNEQEGVWISDGAQGTVVGPHNIIAYNQHGILVEGSASLSNTITHNSIYSNQIGIDLIDGGNNSISSPQILTATAAIVSGTAPAGSRVEVYSDAGDQGRFYEGYTTANAGEWTLTAETNFTGPNLTATATDAAGNTSEFSNPAVLTGTWTVMIYLNGDNNLDGWTFKLFNRLEQAVADNPLLTVLTLWDRRGDGDTVLYHVQPDTLFYVLADYYEGETKWAQGELNMGDPATLVNFVNGSRAAHPADYYFLSIVDHGGGWSPDLLADQARPRWAYGGSGFSWDEHNGFDDDWAYMSTRDMREAFHDITAVGGEIDVVFYDACLMAMIEEVYQLRGYVDYLIASENEIWTSYPYVDYLTDLLPAVTPRDLSVSIVDEYHIATEGHPRTLAAIDVAQIGSTATMLNGLATALLNGLPTSTQVISQTFSSVQKLDYNYDLILSENEGYVDLSDFATGLVMRVPGTAIGEAAQDLLDVLHDPHAPLIIHERHQSDIAWPSSAYLDLDDATGMSIYLPMSEPDGDLDYYLESQLDLAQNTLWDEFLFEMSNLYWGGMSPDEGRGSAPNPGSTVRTLYLPLVLK